MFTVQTAQVIGEAEGQQNTVGSQEEMTAVREGKRREFILIHILVSLLKTIQGFEMSPRML